MNPDPEEQPECPICLLPMVDEEAFLTECAHFFHARCLREWTHRRAACPLCNTYIAFEAEPESANEPPKQVAPLHNPNRLPLLYSAGLAAGLFLFRGDETREHMTVAVC
jgi:hypothetical protein